MLISELYSLEGNSLLSFREIEDEILGFFTSLYTKMPGKRFFLLIFDGKWYLMPIMQCWFLFSLLRRFGKRLNCWKRIRLRVQMAIQLNFY